MVEPYWKVEETRPTERMCKPLEKGKMQSIKSTDVKKPADCSAGAVGTGRVLLWSVFQKELVGSGSLS